VTCSARARVRLCCAPVLLVPANCLLPQAIPVLFPPPQAYPDATGAGEGGSPPLPSAPLKRKSVEDPEYEHSQATSQSEDSRSDVMVRHRMLSSILL